MAKADLKPPFRADHVGSLLRSERLKAARFKFLGEETAETNLGPHGNSDLKVVEDACIREVIAMQERVGLRVATDGELRRRLALSTQCGFTSSVKGNPRSEADEEAKLALIAETAS